MATNDIYQPAFKKYGESPKSLHWINYTSQAIRFKYLVADLNIDEKTILDAGCGMGDLLPFLYAKSNKFSYLGVDSNKNFIEIASKRYFGHQFKVADVFSEHLSDKYDLVISSGVMNQNIEGWQNERREMITRLFELSKETLAFNMAGSFRPIASDPKIAYADASQILQFCLTLTPRVSLRTDYSTYDFTVIMHR